MRREPRSRWKSGPPRTKDQLQTYIPYLFNRLSNRWNLDQNRDLGEHGINNVVFRTLSVLYIYKTLTVNEIAVLAVTEQSTASRMVESMVSSGWVKREIAEEDQRRRMVFQAGNQVAPRGVRERLAVAHRVHGVAVEKPHDRVSMIAAG